MRDFHAADNEPAAFLETMHVVANAYAVHVRDE
jgi:hypothetical protein